jgi:hypothetical protein
MKLCRFSPLGVQRFGNFLESLKNEPETNFPKDLLTFSGYLEVVDEETDLMPYKFKTRWDAAKYLHSLLSNSGLADAERDTHLWAFLTAFYFDVLCPIGIDGKHRIREQAAYIPEPENYKRYYRHLLLGPYLIYRAHLDNPERALALLCKPPHIITDIEAQIAAYQELITNPSVVELVTRLYYDPKTKTTKPGAGGKGPGSPRRLVTILDQFSLTWDLYAASTDEILNLLPKEFEKFAKSIG